MKQYAEPCICYSFSTNMSAWRLHAVLLLPLFVLCSNEETIVKTVGTEPDVTRICPFEMLNSIKRIVCQIRTERRREACQLTYQHGQVFLNECDPRFTLMQANNTVFLHLSNLMPEDSGHYTCECTSSGGKKTLHLSVTVKGPSTSSRAASVVLGLFVAAGLITVAGFSLYYWMKNHRLPCVIIRSSFSVSATPGLSVRDTRSCFDDDTYASLQQPTDDLYQNITRVHCQHIRTDLARSTERACQETDPNELIYENV